MLEIRSSVFSERVAHSGMRLFFFAGDRSVGENIEVWKNEDRQTAPGLSQSCSCSRGVSLGGNHVRVQDGAISGGGLGTAPATHKGSSLCCREVVYHIVAHPFRDMWLEYLAAYAATLSFIFSSLYEGDGR